MSGSYYSFQLDTGSSVIWVGSPDCTGCTDQAISFSCAAPNDCTVIGINMQESYGSGDVYGQTINTVLNIDPGNVTDATIISVNQATGDFSQYPFNGIIGLGPNSQFIELLMNQDFISERSLGFALYPAVEANY